MYLKTIGKPFKVELKLCKDALKFYGHHLLGENLYHKVRVTLHFDKSLTKKNEYALCEWEDNNHRAKEFKITIDPSLGKRNMLLALAHEMVHVKQHAKNELKSGIVVVSRGKLKMTSKWHGEIWKPKRNEDLYFDSPWEVEAYGKEVGLYHKWFAFINERYK